jgi:hypothetical protein
VTFGPQIQNVSQGLFPDGNTNALYFMTNWTPRASNTLAESLALKNLSLNGGVVSLTWSTIAGRTYRLLYKDDLAASSWSQLGGVRQALAPTFTATDSLPPNTHRFYRVIRAD